MSIKFPLMLSCGHSAESMCSCSTPTSYQHNPDSPIDIAMREYNGRWREVLEGYGAQLPSGRKHGPCPICGGKDRFRFDDKNGRGTFFCSHCGSHGGLKLLSMFLGKSTIETAKELVGDTERSSPQAKVKHVDYDKIRAMNIEQAKKNAASLMAIAVKAGHQYMDNKGLAGEWMVNGEMMISGATGERIPAGGLLLVPAYKNGELVNVQKINEEGKKRPISGGDMQGVYNKIDGHTKLIGIVEGYATGVTVNKLTGATVYCGFQTGNLAAVGRYVREQHQSERIVFFADNDEHGAGEKYANEAAAPISALVALPSEIGDWDDYRQKHGDEATKQAMREAISKDAGVAVKQAQAESATKPKPTETPKPKKQDPNLPTGICFDGMDIDEPPGLAGDIVDYIRNGAARVLYGGAYPSMALQCMAMAASGMQGLKGVKLSLITLTLGVSAGGKEHPQRVVKDLLDANGKTIYGDIRSDKDVIRSAIYDNGHCFYVVDEAQKILADSSNQSKHMTNVVSTLMELSTTSCYKLSQLHRDEFITQIEASKSRIEKVVDAKQKDLDTKNPDHEQGQIKAIEHDIEKLKKKLVEMDRRIETAQTGVRNPSLHLLAYSTPQKLAAIVDEDSIESGFLGRALICDCGVERGESMIDLGSFDDCTGVARGLDPDFEHLKVQIGLICQLAHDVSGDDVNEAFSGQGFKYAPTKDAIQDLQAIASHYDQYQYRNHPRVGAIYARLLERVLSLSSVMALGNIQQGVAVVERDYVRYALMLMLNSIEHLISNLKVNEGKTERTIEAKLEAVMEAIIKRISVRKNDAQEGWRYKSQIKDYLKRQKYYQPIQEECKKEGQDAFENALAMIGSKLEKSPCGKKIRLRRG